MRNSNSDHFTRLVDWLEGNLSEAESQALDKELAEIDEVTKADIAWLQRFRQASQELRVAAPPPSVREELERRFELFAEERRLPGFLQRLIAVLSFDSNARWATAGARSATTQGLERQLIFTAGSVEIALNLQPRQGNQQVDLAGQVFTGSTEGIPILSVQLLREREEVSITTTDEIGEFDFEGISPGEYEMIVSGDQMEIVLAPLSLQV
ncbi:MAG: hypothetical protein M3220_09670 [Chloroflexota bacterium]|nr:hypothetical protein [Chloroflexota bacterium]